MIDNPNNQDEMQEIIDLSEQFKKAYPEHADQIDFEQLQNKDPQFRDFLQCFALIASQLRHKIDDGYRNISETLLDSLIPGLLQPKPSLSIITIKATPNCIETIKKDTKITLSNHPHCQFRTLYDTQLHPFTLNNIAHIDNKIHMQFKFNIAPTKPIAIQYFRCHINPNQKNPQKLYHALLKENPDFIKSTQPQQKQHPLQHLMDYFHYPYQFYFLDFYCRQGPTENDFEITYKLTNSIEINTKSLLLSCTPIINCFPHQAEPFIIDSNKSHQNLILDKYHHDLKLHSIKKITLTSNTRKIQCHPIFYHDYHLKPEDTVYWSYHNNNSKTQLCFSDHRNLMVDAPVIAHTQTHCSNGDKPSEYISNSDTHLQIQADTEAYLQLRALLVQPLSVYYEPLLSDQQRFNLIQYCQISLKQLMQQGNLLQLIDLLAQSCNTDPQKITHEIASITTQAIKIRPSDVKYHCLYSGIKCIMTLNPPTKTSEHEWVFFDLLHHCLMHYCPINTILILVIQNTTGEILKQWNETPGKHYLI